MVVLPPLPSQAARIGHDGLESMFSIAVDSLEGVIDNAINGMSSAFQGGRVLKRAGNDMLWFMETGDAGGRGIGHVEVRVVLG